MLIKTLYRIIRPDGGTTITLEKPSQECTELFRIIADEGKAVTKDGETLYGCVDADSAEGFYEVDAPTDAEET